jgi:hypothetical protein
MTANECFSVTANFRLIQWPHVAHAMMMNFKANQEPKTLNKKLQIKTNINKLKGFKVVQQMT